MRKNVDHVLLAILAIVCVLGALGWGTEWEFRRQAARGIGLNAGELERRMGAHPWHYTDRDGHERFISSVQLGSSPSTWVSYDLDRSKIAVSFHCHGYDQEGCKLAWVEGLRPPVDWLHGMAMWESTDPMLVSQWIQGFWRHDSHDDSTTTAVSFNRKRSRGVGH